MGLRGSPSVAPWLDLKLGTPNTANDLPLTTVSVISSDPRLSGKTYGESDLTAQRDGAGGASLEAEAVEQVARAN